jgi:hypothetical protein
VIWLCRIARSSLAILRQPIAKQAMPFGDRLSLKSESNLSNILLLNICWRLGDEQSLSVRELILPIAKHLLAILATSYRLNRNGRV